MTVIVHLYPNAVYRSDGERQMNNGNEIQKGVETGY